MGLRVPEDMSVIGINNIRISEYTQLPLSTIDTNPEEVCKLAWDIIQKKQKSKYYHIRQAITITGRLILRSTTGQCKK
jgi:DNA-binding LacI/PurR family transcriptional regulator